VSYDNLLDDLIQGAAFPSREEASTAVHGVVDALGDTLTADDADALADALPPPLGSVLLRGSHGGLGGDTFYDRVGAHVDVTADLAKQQARAVLRALAHDLPAPLRQRLAGALPGEVDVAVEPPPKAPPARAPRARRRNGNDIDNGRAQAGSSPADVPAAPAPASGPADK
jgi:uncharacterized protein (DUF2267 family)